MVASGKLPGKQRGRILHIIGTVDALETSGLIRALMAHRGRFLLYDSH